MQLLALCGSLRQVSTNRALLTAIAAVAPKGVTITLYDELGRLPLFNPDLETPAPPASVAALSNAICAADGLIISSPEYAHGVPGAFKNALDWLVSHPELPYKPVMLVSATHRGQSAQNALREILTTMSLHLVREAEATVSLIGKTPEQCTSLLARDEIRARLGAALGAFCQAISTNHQRRPGA